MLQPTKSGASYFIRGFDLISIKGLKRFVLIPLLINLTLFGGAFYYLFLQLEELFTWLDGYIPDYLSWLNVVLWPLAIVIVLVMFSFLFSSVANWIAAPFNGILSEKVENHLTNTRIADGGFAEVIKDLPRTLSREWRKLKYYLPKAIGCLLLFLIPVLGQTVAPVLWFLLTAWMMAVQYCDYPYDNHKISFDEMKSQLQNDRGTALSFGTMVTLFSMIPVVNLVVMPVAICGATALWVDKYRAKTL